MSAAEDLNTLWETTPPTQKTFAPAQITTYPEPVQRYFKHSLEPGTPLASAVRLEMHGEIKLQDWYPFSAEQVIRWDRGMIWRARVRMYGILPVRGFDRLVDGEGEQQWKMLGLIPVVATEGVEVTRSNAGRMGIESVWLPAVLLDPGVHWSQQGENEAQAQFTLAGETLEPRFSLAENGALTSVSMRRWGDPGEGGFRYADFGGEVLAESTFEGFTIPTQLHIGWFYGSERFASEGEFFRVTVDRARFR